MLRCMVRREREPLQSSNPATPAQRGARIQTKPMPSTNVAAMCENNFGQGETPRPKSAPHIWYYLQPCLNTPDQLVPIPTKLFGPN